MKKILLLINLTLLITACKTPELRQPINKKRQYTSEKQDDAYQKTIAKEQVLFKKIREKNTQKKFINSGNGFWYYYINKNDKQDAPTAKYSNKVNFRYEVYGINGDTIYTEKELGKRIYYIEQQNIMAGLKDALKILKQGETAQFFFPSFKAYGVHGDEKKITEPNTPLICKVTVDSITTD